MTTKTCSRCKQTKDVSEFSKDSSTPDGLQYYCKECQRQYNKCYLIDGRTFYTPEELYYRPPEHRLEALQDSHEKALRYQDIERICGIPRSTFQQWVAAGANDTVDAILLKVLEVKMKGGQATERKEAARQSGPKELAMSV